jgi:hypothetical protein
MEPSIFDNAQSYQAPTPTPTPPPSLPDKLRARHQAQREHHVKTVAQRPSNEHSYSSGVTLPVPWKPVASKGLCVSTPTHFQLALTTAPPIASQTTRTTLWAPNSAPSLAFQVLEDIKTNGPVPLNGRWLTTTVNPMSYLSPTRFWSPKAVCPFIYYRPNTLVKKTSSVASIPLTGAFSTSPQASTTFYCGVTSHIA